MNEIQDPPEPGWTARLAGLRAEGWCVAVHHDYLQGGTLRTFWLFTGPDGTCLKAEGAGDGRALSGCTSDGAGRSRDTDAEAALDALRGNGWQVAIHNDFRLGGRPHTFWRFVRPSDRRYLDGEGPSDGEALQACLAEAGLASPRAEVSAA